MARSIRQLVERMSQRRVLVVGDVMMDEYVDGDSSRISAEAPVPVLRFTGRSVVLGGAANTAANVASLGGQVTLVGLVGDDASGAELAAGCDALGIRFVPLTDGRPTTRKVRVISQHQQLLRIDYEDGRDIDAACQAQLLRSFLDHLDAAEVVVMSDYAKGLLTREVCGEVIGAAHRVGRDVIIDPRPHHGSFYQSCDYLTPNWKESLALLREADTDMTEENIRRVGRSVSTTFHTNVLLTLGPRGIAFVRRDSGDVFIAPAEAQDVFDVSGAGDTVVAAFALAHAAGCDDTAAVGLANRAAAVVVGKRGTATVAWHELLEPSVAEPRVLTDDELHAFRDRQRHRRQRLVTIAGTFEDLRGEEFALLAQAKAQGDVLVVALCAPDADHGQAPDPIRVAQMEQRAETLLGLRAVDFVYLCEGGRLLEFLRMLKPDVHVTPTGHGGRDAEAVSSLGVRCHVVGRA
jgi:D-beta-D-heptose 7-phosphate kinase/D-beta-D-heptose 1-phosphate adenosyltransferase